MVQSKRVDTGRARLLCERGRQWLGPMPLNARCENDGCGQVVFDLSTGYPNMRRHKRLCDVLSVDEREARQHTLRTGAKPKTEGIVAKRRIRE